MSSSGFGGPPMTFSRFSGGRGRGHRSPYFTQTSRSNLFSKQKQQNILTKTEPGILRVGILGTNIPAQRGWASVHAGGHRVIAVGGINTKTAAIFILNNNSPVVGVEFQQLQEEHLNVLLLQSETGEKIIIKKKEEEGKEGGKKEEAEDNISKKAPVWACDYEGLVNNKEIDIIYLFIPPSERDQWVTRCIRQKKHIILSSPAAPSATVLRRWIELAAPLRLLLINDAALLYQRSRQVKKIKEMIKQLGGPLRVVRAACSPGPAASYSPISNINFLTSNNIWDWSNGVVGEFCWNVLCALLNIVAQNASESAVPSAVLARVLRHNDEKKEKKVITELSVEMLFTDEDPNNSKIHPSTTNANNNDNDNNNNNIVSSNSFKNMSIQDQRPRHVTVALYLSQDGAAEQTLTAYTTKGSVTLNELLLTAPHTNIPLTVATSEVTQTKQDQNKEQLKSQTHGLIRRTIRREVHVPILDEENNTIHNSKHNNNNNNNVEDKGNKELMWQYIKEVLTAGQSGQFGAVRYRGDTEDGLAAMRSTWTSQTVMDSILNAVEQS